MLKLRKIWNEEDSSLVKEGRYMESGFQKYWNSLDSAIQFWNQHLAPKNNPKGLNPAVDTERGYKSRRFSNAHFDYSHSKQDSSRFKWRSDKYRRVKLPTPHLNSKL